MRLKKRKPERVPSRNMSTLKPLEQCHSMLFDFRPEIMFLLEKKHYSNTACLCVWDRVHSLLRRLILAVQNAPNTNQQWGIRYLLLLRTPSEHFQVDWHCALCLFVLACKEVVLVDLPWSWVQTAANRCGRKSGNGAVLQDKHLRMLKDTEVMLLEILDWNVGRNSYSIVDIIELLINHDVADILQTRAKLLQLKKCVTMASDPEHQEQPILDIRVFANAFLLSFEAEELKKLNIHLPQHITAPAELIQSIQEIKQA